MLNIVVPVYNARDTLSDLLDSLVAQTKKMFIITLVNDCDGLDYSDIIKTYTDRGLHIIYLECPENRGPGCARQFGVDNIKRCDYVSFCDADDMVTPYYVDTLYTLTKSAGADVGISPIFVEKKAGMPRIIELEDCTTWLHGKCYKVDYLRKNNIRFYDDIRCNEDGAFNLLAVNMTQKRQKLSTPVYLWRDYKGSITRENILKFNQEGNQQHILGTIRSTIRLIEEGYFKEDNLTLGAASMVSTAYNFSECSRLIGGALDKANPVIKEMLKKPYVQNLFKTRGNTKIILEKIQTYRDINKKIYSFKESFYSWLKRMGDIDIEKLEFN